MAFLDNSGDIILDAVLTDTGRYRLAKGDGSFRIAKFALADDEIDYGLYDLEAAVPDLEILSTPVFEAFTDNITGLKSKLLSIPRNDLLYLPVVKLNTLEVDSTQASSDVGSFFCVAVDEVTEQLFTTSAVTTAKQGVFGSVVSTNFPSRIVLNQGLDTPAIPPTNIIDSDLKETQYIIEIDSRLATVTSVLRGAATTVTNAEISYIDDDQIASYYLTLTANTGFVESIGNNINTQSSIQGPRGTRLSFGLKGTLDLQYSTFFFEQLGSQKTLNINGIGSQTYHTIDTNVRVMGATTGYRIDIPVRFLKKV